VIVTRAHEAALHALVGGNVRAHRHRLGLTLSDLARRTGLSVALLSMMERGATGITLTNLFRVAAALDLQITVLFDGHATLLQPPAPLAGVAIHEGGEGRTRDGGPATAQ